MFRANYHVDNPFDNWKISLYLVFLETLDHLVEEISKQLANNEERFFWGGILSKPCKSTKHNTCNS